MSGSARCRCRCMSDHTRPYVPLPVPRRSSFCPEPVPPARYCLAAVYILFVFTRLSVSRTKSEKRALEILDQGGFCLARASPANAPLVTAGMRLDVRGGAGYSPLPRPPLPLPRHMFGKHPLQGVLSRETRGKVDIC